MVEPANAEAMNNPSQCALIRSTTGAPLRVLLALMLAAGSAASVRAQANPQWHGYHSGSNPYDYSLSFSDASSATSPIGSVWYAWVPGAFDLPATPLNASAPAGWTATVDDNSIQFIASSAANDIKPGQTLSGFSYHAAFSPAQLVADPDAGISVAYAGPLESDAGQTFAVQAVPEPSTLMLLISGAAGLFLARPGLGRRLL